VNGAKSSKAPADFVAEFYSEPNPERRWGIHPADIPRPFPAPEDAARDRFWTCLLVELRNEEPEPIEDALLAVGLDPEDVITITDTEETA
jgi:hypothetical protein